MTGVVDEQLRAWIRVPVSASQSGSREELQAWIDTGFNGALTIPRAQIASLGLQHRSSLDAVLADGRTVTVETFVCVLDWFGNTYQSQVVASDGAHPLLGTQLLAGRRLTVDYAARAVELS